jgi:hypothetical protein
MWGITRAQFTLGFRFIETFFVSSSPTLIQMGSDALSDISGASPHPYHTWAHTPSRPQRSGCQRHECPHLEAIDDLSNGGLLEHTQIRKRIARPSRCYLQRSPNLRLCPWQRMSSSALSLIRHLMI